MPTTADALLLAIGEPDVEMPPPIRMALEAPPLLNAVEYAERHIVLPHGSNARSGPYSVAAAPYSREWLLAMSDRSVRQVTLITSTQVGKSTALLLRLCWGIACDPSPMLCAVSGVSMRARGVLTPCSATTSLVSHLSRVTVSV